MVVASRAVLVSLLKVSARTSRLCGNGGVACHSRHVLAEDLLALFACKYHLHGLGQLVLLGLGVALGAVKPAPSSRRYDVHSCSMSAPELAARRAHLDLSSRDEKNAQCFIDNASIVSDYLIDRF